MALPSGSAVGKAVLMTALALVLIKAIRPSLPVSLQNFLPAL